LHSKLGYRTYICKGTQLWNLWKFKKSAKKQGITPSDFKIEGLASLLGMQGFAEG